MPIASDFSSGIRFEAPDYNLAATVCSGQAFRWRSCGEGWESVVAGRWVHLASKRNRILVQTAEPVRDWTWIADYLQVNIDLDRIVGTFPKDGPMRAAVEFCRGLRLLRQDPWECLASFVLSSSKQIVQIQEIVRLLCEQFGETVRVPPGHPPVYSFPSAERLAQCSETELRFCKMGFRAPYLKRTAAMIATCEVDLKALPGIGVGAARSALLNLPGVGRKIADCVLLFAYGFQEAFPIDVWVMRALRELYFRGEPVPLKRLQRFSDEYFGPFGGYAQQYLFHYMRQPGSSADGKSLQRDDGVISASEISVS